MVYCNWWSIKWNTKSEIEDIILYHPTCEKKKKKKKKQKQKTKNLLTRLSWFISFCWPNQRLAPTLSKFNDPPRVSLVTHQMHDIYADWGFKVQMKLSLKGQVQPKKLVQIKWGKKSKRIKFRKRNVKPRWIKRQRH